MKVTWASGRIDPATLYELLTKHRLLTDEVSDPQKIVALAGSANFGALHDGEELLAYLFEINHTEWLIELFVIPEIKYLNQRREILSEAGRSLHDRWFIGTAVRRVEANVVGNRTQTIRALKHMGFKQETAPMGLRGRIHFKGRPESIQVLSMMAHDLPKSVNESCAKMSSDRE